MKMEEMLAAAAPEEFRAELERVIASAEFASSRQAQDFLRFASERSLEGETHLDQVEIARAVLGRGEDFNPVEDAGVRKLASQVRQRLNQYYLRTGKPKTGMILMPVRSYLPRFEATPAVEDAPAVRRWKWEWWLAAALVLVIGLGGLLAVRWRAKGEPAAALEIATVRGDIGPTGMDAPPESVRIGPELMEVDEISTLLDFSPAQEAQQAGVIVWGGPTQFIRMGRRFVGRNQLYFGLSAVGESDLQQGTQFDAEGQSGKPLWVSIRRRQNEYRAYVSFDGLRWETAGEPIVPKKAFEHPRGGVFAFHGRRDAAPARARFLTVNRGLTFGGEQGIYLELMAGGGWQREGNCKEQVKAVLLPLTLGLSFDPVRPQCNFEILRPIDGDEWEIETKLDFMPRPGVSAGLAVHTDKSTVRLARYFLNGAGVALIHDGHQLVGDADFNGSPALVLRLRARAGKLWGAYSRDGVNYRELKEGVVLSGKARVGLRITTTALEPGEAGPLARFYWFRERVRELRAYR